MNLLSVIAIFFAGLFCSCDTHLPLIDEPYPQTDKHVVLIIMDGVRYSEGWGDTSGTNIPFIKNHLAPQATVFTNFFTEAPTYTQSGHTAMFTGYNQVLNNAGSATPAHPNFLQLYRSQYEAGDEDAWLIASKGKIAALKNTTNGAYADQYLPSTNCGLDGLNTPGQDRTDSATMMLAENILLQKHPHAMVIQLRETDAGAHTGNWQAYIDAIRRQDAMIYNLYSAIQSDSVLKEETYFLVTNDHGRHLDKISDGFISHGDDCEGCRHIFLLAAGPGILKGIENTKYHALHQVFSLACEALGVNAGNQNPIFSEIFIK